MYFSFLMSPLRLVMLQRGETWAQDEKSRLWKAEGVAVGLLEAVGPVADERAGQAVGVEQLALLRLQVENELFAAQHHVLGGQGHAPLGEQLAALEVEVDGVGGDDVVLPEDLHVAGGAERVLADRLLVGVDDGILAPGLGRQRPVRGQEQKKEDAKGRLDFHEE